MAAAWDEPVPGPDRSGAPRDRAPTLVSLHYLRAALRRRWRVWTLSGALGLLAASAFLAVVPPPHTATATLLLAHEPQQDPSRGMATDVSLLTTRTVAERTIARLRLTDRPDDLLKAIRVVPESSDVLQVTLTDRSDAAAVRRLDVLTEEYLVFRADQLTAQSDVLIDGMKQRIGALQEQVTQASERIDTLSATDAGGNALGDAVSERAELSSQVGSLQQQVEEATLRTTSIVAASRVIDAPAPDPARSLRYAALALASGLIGGLALGGGAVLFQAITSDRLRRRREVATALGTAVTLSVRRLTPVPRRLRRLTNLVRGDERRAVDRRRLAQVLEFVLPLPAQPRRLVVACVDNADEVRFGVVAAGMLLTEGGHEVTLVDLSAGGGVREALSLLAGTAGGRTPTVLRPLGMPALARGPADLARAGGTWNPCSPEDLGPDRIVLVLAELDPAIGNTALGVWADRAVVAVTAGRSGEERVRTAAELVRDAGLDLCCAVLLHADARDDSCGLGPPARATAAGGS